MNRETLNTDLLIIGAGPGGYVAAIYAARKGLDVVLVDRQYLGGTCLNVGCIPTKALVKAADLYLEMREAHKFGLKAESVTFDLGEIIDRKDAVTSTLVGGIMTLLDKNKVRFLKGSCEFTGTKTARIDQGDKQVDVGFKNAIIATGSKTKHLPIPGTDLDLVYDSDKLLANKILPKTLVVIGGGIIGMEFAFVYGRMGVNVQVIEFLPQILPSLDKDLSQRLHRYAKQANITITTGAKVTGIARNEAGQAVVTYIHKDEEKHAEGDLVLEAVGRGPVIEGLQLEKAGIIRDRQNAITVDRRMRTNVPGIYAIGDVTNIMQLAHVASHQAIVAVDNIVGTAKEMDYQAVPSVIFTAPQIATIGKNENDLQAGNVPYTITKVPFAANGKALIMDNSQGFIKLLADPDTGTLLGAAVFGGDAETLIAPLTVAMQSGMTASELKETIFAHPTMAELVHEGAMGLLGEAIHYLG